MGRFWDRRAREDALYFVDNRLAYGEADPDLFWSRGEQDLDAVLDAIGLEVRPDDVVVDIGCGLGRLTRVLAARASRVVALDVSGEMLARARELNPGLGNVTWLHGDGRSLAGVPDRSATLCLSLIVFQHIPDPEVTLGYVHEMGRVLAPGGHAAFGFSDDPVAHRRRSGAGAWRVRLGALVGRAPGGQANSAWLGSAVPLGEVERAAAEAGMAVRRFVWPGTQFCLAHAVKD
jgi:SAM-dependent methyltransferase